MNARTKSHAAEISAKQARADSEYARVRAHEVAPDFIQPGEIKRLPEIILDIDRISLQGGGLGADMSSFSNMSPNQDNRSQKIQAATAAFMERPATNNPNGGMDTNYMNWPQQQQQHLMAPHSSTPPPPMLRPQHQPTPTRTFNQFQYDHNLLLPQQHRISQQFQQQHSMEFNPVNNLISSNQLLMQQQQQLHPSIDPITGHKINNESNLGRFFFFLFEKIILVFRHSKRISLNLIVKK